MAVNKDGIEAGKPVDFETLMQIKAKQRGKRDGDTRKAERAERKDDSADKPEAESAPLATRKKKAKEI